MVPKDKEKKGFGSIRKKRLYYDVIKSVLKTNVRQNIFYNYKYIFVNKYIKIK